MFFYACTAKEQIITVCGACYARCQTTESHVCSAWIFLHACTAKEQIMTVCRFSRARCQKVKSHVMPRSRWRRPILNSSVMIKSEYRNKGSNGTFCGKDRHGAGIMSLRIVSGWNLKRTPTPIRWLPNKSTRCFLLDKRKSRRVAGKVEGELCRAYLVGSGDWQQQGTDSLCSLCWELNLVRLELFGGNSVDLVQFKKE